MLTIHQLLLLILLLVGRLSGVLEIEGFHEVELTSGVQKEWGENETQRQILCLGATKQNYSIEREE